MYTSAIYAQKFSKDYRAAERLLEELRLKSIAAPSFRTPKRSKQLPLSLSIAPFNALLAVYQASNAPIERKQKLLGDISALGLAWDERTYTALFLGEANKSHVIELWRSLASSNSSSSGSNSVFRPSYVSIIKTLVACVHLNASSAAIDVIEYLWGKLNTLNASNADTVYIPMTRLMPSANEARIYTLALYTLYRTGDTEGCINLHSRVKDRGYVPSSVMDSVVMRAIKVCGAIYIMTPRIAYVVCTIF